LVFGSSLYAYENGKELISSTAEERFSLKGRMETFDVDIEYLTNQRLHNQTFSDSKRVSHPSYRVIHFKQYCNILKPKDLLRSINPLPFVPNIQEEAGSKVCKEILSIQSTALARRLNAIGCKKVTIGISGGLDSTLAFLIIIEAYKKIGIDNKNMIAVTMPGFGTTDRTYTNAVNLVKEFGATLKEISIKEACLVHFKDIGQDENTFDITYENSQARERTQILMDIANKEGALVIGTGDLSELALGWCTYNGDHMSMYAVNTSIPKTLVRYLVKWIADTHETTRDTIYDILDTPISPELLPPTKDGKIAQKTESSVGPYILHDFFLYQFLRNGFKPSKIYFIASETFKGMYEDAEIKKWLTFFIRRFFTQQFKRSCMPDGPKVGTISLSPRGDLRMPSDADFEIWLKDLENI